MTNKSIQRGSGARTRRRRCRRAVKRSLVPGGQLVLLFSGPGSSHGRQVVDRAHAVDGGVELLQLLPDVVELLGVWCQVTGVRLAGLAAPFIAWTKRMTE